MSVKSAKRLPIPLDKVDKPLLTIFKPPIFILPEVPPIFKFPEENKFVANIFGQYKYGADRKYTDYKALEKGIKWVHDISQLYSLSSVAIPYKIGCGLAGGDWSIVINIIREYFEYSNIECIIYRLEE